MRKIYDTSIPMKKGTEYKEIYILSLKTGINGVPLWAEDLCQINVLSLKSESQSLLI